MPPSPLDRTASVRCRSCLFGCRKRGAHIPWFVDPLQSFEAFSGMCHKPTKTTVEGYLSEPPRYPIVVIAIDHQPKASLHIHRHPAKELPAQFPGLIVEVVLSWQAIQMLPCQLIPTNSQTREEAKWTTTELISCLTTHNELAWTKVPSSPSKQVR